MDHTFYELKDLYEKMYSKLENEVAALDGEIKEFSPEIQSIYIEVDPKFKDYIEEFAMELLAEYTPKLQKVMQEDVFFGVKTLLLDDTDD